MLLFNEVQEIIYASVQFNYCSNIMLLGETSDGDSHSMRMG
jgi:hypothetical protein